MDCDGSTTDDDSTEDEEEAKTDDVNVNNGAKLRCQNYFKPKGKGVEEKCSDSGAEGSSTVWRKGNSCLAPYSGDNQYYEAVIVSIQDTSSGHGEAVVTFIGYESEGSEVVPVTALRKTTTEHQNNMTRKNTGTDVVPSTTEDDFFFTHLKGNEAEESMRLKYGGYDVSSLNGQEEMDSEKKHDHIKTKVSVSSSKSKKKGKLNVLIQCSNKRQRSDRNTKNKKKSSSIIEEAEEVCKMSRCEGNPPESPNTSTRPQNTTFDDSKNKKSDGENELDENEMIADGFDDQDMERPSFTEPAVHPSVPLLLSKLGVNPVIQVPATINRYLRDYQRDGIRFLFQHYSENTGAILGDDMGLGKTVQVISFIAAVLGKTGTKADIFSKFMDGKGKEKVGKLSHEKGAFLVVSPGSVMYNWRDELETWGHFKTGLFHDKAREATLERASRGRLDVAVTTYETMRNHLDDLNQIKWLAVIMDEVHRLKDPKAQITVAAKALKVKRRYGLTGTPLQNKLAEFWCVLDWANPGSQPYDATKRELAVGRKKSKDLQSKIGRCFLRRTKDLIADQLPKKDELVAFCPLTPFQEDVYQTLLQNPDVEMIRKKNFPCDCGSGEDRGRCCYTLSSEGEDIKTVTMRFFQLLLKVANHAALLAPTVKQSKDQQEKAKELCLRVFARYPEFSGRAEMSSFELLSDPKYCGKMKVLEKLLKVFKEEHSKLLLFSRSTQLLNILEEFVISKGLVYSRLDGSTKPADRTRLVHEFNVDPSISLCLVSTKAGGLGLNFTGANVVIIFEPCWNPSSDLQAQDRAYRIGQRRDVRVYRLISSGTIEEMMYLRQVYKQQLANIAVGGTNERRYFTGVEGEKDRKGELFGLENLFSYRAEGASLSKDIVKRREKLEAGYRVTKYEIVHEKKQEDGAEDEVTNGTVNPNLEEDPYNLEEIASQLIGDDEARKRAQSAPESQKMQHSELDMKNKSLESTVIENRAREGMESKGITDEEEILCELDNSELCLSDDDDDSIEKEISSFKSCSLYDEFLESPMKSAARKCVSFKLTPSSDDEDLKSNKLSNNFTRLKEKASASLMKCPGSFTEESCNIIPPTSSFSGGVNSRIAGKVNTEDSEEEDSSCEQEDESYDLRNSSEKSSSSEEEDCDEGLFSIQKPSQRGFKKSKPVNIPCSKARTTALEEGRSRFRRFPGKKPQNIDVDSKEAVTAAKRSRKGNTVDEILESCGVHYTHANRHIVGPSEAENHMSKQALQDVFELRQFSQQPANCFPALETSDESDDLGEGTHDKQLEVPRHTEQPEAGSSRVNEPPLRRSTKTDGGVTMERIGNNTIFIGSTPRGIRRQHFREMSDVFGFSSEVDLAKAIVDASENERREMLKRYYVGKNPVLSGLSSFTETSSVEDLKEKHGEKRSVESARKEFSHGTSKRSKRNLQKRKSKLSQVKSHGGEACSEEKFQRHKIQRLGDESTPQSKEPRATAAALEDKQRENCDSGSAMSQKKNNSVHRRNCGLAVAGPSRSTATNLMEQTDVKCASTTSNTDENFIAETQSSSLENTSEVSILDEFLMSDSSRPGREMNDSGRRMDKWNNSQKEGERVDKTEEKETSKPKKNPTSVLDDFI
ncbi:hypothetical protein ACROYT_G043643 [Oculina patagonica]